MFKVTWCYFCSNGKHRSVLGCIIPILQEYSFEIYLVNAKHVKNVTGRKDDESDAEWIQKLHSCGLLHASFQPDNMMRTLRSMVRHKKNLMETSSIYSQQNAKGIGINEYRIAYYHK